MENNNKIDLSLNLKSFFNRIDGKIAGPFVENKNSTPFTYFDVKYHELYNQNGTLSNGTLNADEELVSIFTKKVKNPKIIDLFVGNIDLTKNIDEEFLCQCDDCKFSRESILNNVDTELITNIKNTYEEIKKFDTNIPELPNFFNIAVSTQKQIYYGLKKSLSQYIKIPKENKTEILIEILDLQKKIFIEKNILINDLAKKLKKYNLSDLNNFLDSLIDLHKNVKRFDYVKIMDVLLIKKSKLSKKDINDYSVFSGVNLNINEINILNPSFIYSFKIENGIIKAIIPISKNK